jgi:hypothetical protein
VEWRHGATDLNGSGMISKTCHNLALLVFLPAIISSALAQTVPSLAISASNKVFTLGWSASGSPSPQNVISWNVGVNSTITGAGQSAGIIKTPYWNNTLLMNGNATGDTVNCSNLLDNSGSATTACVTQHSSQHPWDYWAINSNTPGPDSDATFNRRLLNGYQNKGDSEAPYVSSITISNIPYASYDLVAYFSSDTAGRIGHVTVGGSTYYFSTLGPLANAGTNALFVQTTEMNSLNSPGADYAVFSNLTGSSQQIQVSIPDWGGLAGFQISRAPSVASSASNLVLQETSSLTPPVTWQTSSLAVNSNNGNFLATFLATSSSRFFRLGTAPPFAFAGAYLTNGLVAYWKLHDGAGYLASDSSGNQNPLPLVGTPPWGPGFLSLNGATQYGDAGSNFVSSLDLRDKTICAWINKTGSSQKGIVDKSFDVSGFGYGGWGFWVLADGHLEWTVADANPYYDSGSAAIDLNRWTFVTVVWHYSSQIADFYVNGVVNSAVQTAAGERASGAARVQVGNIRNNLSSGTYAFDGSMRDVAIYNRALSAAEVGSNFLATEFNTNVPAPDLLYYKMTEHNQSNPPVVLADSSTGGTTPGTLFAPNVVQWQPNVASIPETSIHFNGTATYIDTSNLLQLNFTTNLFTINLWVMPLTANGYLLDNEDSSTNGWYLSVGGAYGLNIGANAGGAGTAVSTANGAVKNGLFTMVTLVRTDATNVLIYLNGNKTATTGSFMSPAISSQSLLVGRDRAGMHFLDGNLWLLQMWNEPLTPSDVVNLYLNQISGLPWP